MGTMLVRNRIALPTGRAWSGYAHVLGGLVAAYVGVGSDAWASGVACSGQGAPIVETAGHELAGQASAPESAGLTETLPDKVAFQKGAYTAFIAPFNVGAMIYRQQYDEGISVVKRDFPNASHMKWSYPSDAASSPIKAFLAIDYGNYNHTTALTRIEAGLVRGISRLTLCADLSLAGDLSGFDVIVDYYLTSEPGNLDRKILEIEVALHLPAFFLKYADSEPDVGIYTSQDGVRWHVSQDRHAAMMDGKPDVLVYPADRQDRLQASVDLKGLHDFLMANRVITGDEYFNGLALGVEPQQGSGNLAIRSFAVDYSTSASAK